MSDNQIKIALKEAKAGKTKSITNNWRQRLAVNTIFFTHSLSNLNVKGESKTIKSLIDKKENDILDLLNNNDNQLENIKKHEQPLL